MTIPEFKKVAPALSKLVAAGATLPVACRALGVSENTARAWIRKGRLNPAGTYGAFAAGIDAAKAPRRGTGDESGQMTLDEWESHLAEAVRTGSVAAMKLWADTHVAGAGQQESAPDALGFVDELASRRSTRA